MFFPPKSLLLFFSSSRAGDPTLQRRLSFSLSRKSSQQHTQSTGIQLEVLVSLSEHKNILNGVFYIPKW